MTKLTPDEIKAQLRCLSIVHLRELSKWLEEITNAGELALTVRYSSVKGAAHLLNLKPATIYQRLYRAGVSARGLRK